MERLKAARPDIAIGADIIAGFPTETEAMHRNNVSIVQECQIVHGHVFPFSPRKGTPAARMPQVDPRLIKQRATEVRTAVAEQAGQWRQTLTGSVQTMLVEKSGRTGHAENFARLILTRHMPPGTLAKVAITGIHNNDLIAEPLS